MDESLIVVYHTCWDRLKVIIDGIKSFKSKYKIKKCRIHPFESFLLDETYSKDILSIRTYVGIGILQLLEKVLKDEVGYMIYDNYITNFYPLILAGELFFVETDVIIDNYDEEIMKDIIHYKKGVEQIKNKLSNPNFLLKANKEIIELEKKKLIDFDRTWELSSIAYLRYTSIYENI